MINPMAKKLNAAGFQPAFLPSRLAHLLACPSRLSFRLIQGRAGQRSPATSSDVLGTSASHAAELPEKDEEKLSDEGGKREPASMAFIVRHGLQLIDVPARRTQELLAKSRDMTFRCRFGDLFLVGIAPPSKDERLMISRRLALASQLPDSFVDFAFQFLMASTFQIRTSGKSDHADRLRSEFRRRLGTRSTALSEVRTEPDSIALTIAPPGRLAIAFKSFRIKSKAIIVDTERHLPLPGKILDVLPGSG